MLNRLPAASVLNCCTPCQAQAAVQAAVQSSTQFGIASAAPSQSGSASQPLVPLVGGAGAATVTSPKVTVTSAETIAEVTITNPVCAVVVLQLTGCVLCTS